MLRIAAIWVFAALLVIPAASSDVSLSSAVVADRVIVLKSERKLMLMKDGKMLKTYRVSLGANPVGPKIHQGDHKTPEGEYILDRHNVHSQYYRSIHISYPSHADRERAHRLGLSPGGDVFVHGLPNNYKPAPNEDPGDWTDGCIAVTDAEMDEIWRAVPDGTPIEIKP